MRALAVAVMVVMVGARPAGAEASFADLLKKLADAAPKDRPQATRMIGYSNDPARFDVLEKLCGDADPAVRVVALEGLSPSYLAVGKQPRWKALRKKLLNDPDAKVRGEVARQLRPPEPDEVAPLLARLKIETDPAVTDTLLLELHDVHAPGLVELAIPLLKDPKRARSALSVLGYTRNDPRVVPALLEALANKVDGAIYALGATGDPKALEAVLGVLRTSSDPEELAAAAAVQQGNPDPRAVPRLLELWTKLSRADRADSLTDPFQPGAGGYPISISQALVAIAAIDPAPCDAAPKAKPDVRAYLGKLLPKGCQTEIRAALVELVRAEIGDQERFHTTDARFAVLADRDEPALPTAQVAGALTAYTVTKIVHAGAVPGAGGEGGVVSVVAKVTLGGKEAELRLSALAVPATKGWAIAGGLWSIGRANGAVNAAAVAGKLALKPLGRGDAGLAEEVAKIVEGQVDTLTAQRADFTAIGSAPGELVKSGAAFFTAYGKAWAGKTTIEGPIATVVAPGGRTAIAVANVALAKTQGTTSYKVPFRVLFGLDKASGRWSLVHVHFATPAP